VRPRVTRLRFGGGSSKLESEDALEDDPEESESVSRLMLLQDEGECGQVLDAASPCSGAEYPELAVEGESEERDSDVRLKDEGDPTVIELKASESV
jgi:hypothetical protein